MEIKEEKTKTSGDETPAGVTLVAVGVLVISIIFILYSLFNIILFITSNAQHPKSDFLINLVLIFPYFIVPSILLLLLSHGIWKMYSWAFYSYIIVFNLVLFAILAAFIVGFARGFKGPDDAPLAPVLGVATILILIAVNIFISAYLWKVNKQNNKNNQ